MTINLSIRENQHWALFRVLVMPPNQWTNPRQSWQVLPSPPRWNIHGAAAGYELLRCRRVCLPDLGLVQFRYRFGRIDGRDYGIDTAAGALDLTNWAIRLQVAPAPALELLGSGSYNQAELAWRTCWLGTVELQQDIVKPAANYLMGDRIYHCVDILGLTKKWTMQNHAYSFDAGVGVCRGHPGYNRREGDGAMSGNRSDEVSRFLDDSTIDSFCHTTPGQGFYWTDEQALANALVASRSIGSPLFEVDDPCGLLGGTEAWDIGDTDKCFDFLNKVCPRQRGRGLAYAAWEDDVGDPTGNIQPFLAIRSQGLSSITYNRPSDGGAVTILGAEATSSAVDIDLEGDHRVIEGSFKLGGRAQHKVEYLEVPGEQIEAVITAGYPDSLFEEKWSPGSAVSFDALLPDQRRGDRYDLVYHLHGLPDSWRVTAGNGNGSGSNHVCDYHCVNGGIGQTSSSVLPESSMASIEILPSLPIHSNPSDTTRFVRSPPLLLMNVGADRFLDGRRHLGLELRIREDGFHVSKNEWDDEGFRYVGDLGYPTHQAAYSYTNLALTFAIRLPHRIMYNFGNRDTAGRRLTLPIAKDMRLWLVSNDAITALDLENGTLVDGYAPIRGDEGSPGAGTYRILRDNRDQLARRGHLAWSWYGTFRQTVTYQMKSCMLLPSFEVEDDRGTRSEIEYPRLGQLVRTLQAGGVANEIHTPITGIDYDNETQISTLETDWSDLDLRTT